MIKTKIKQTNKKKELKLPQERKTNKKEIFCVLTPGDEKH